MSFRCSCHAWSASSAENWLPAFPGMPARNLAVSSASRWYGTVSAQTGAACSAAALALGGACADFWHPKSNTGKASNIHFRLNRGNEPPGFPNLYLIVSGDGPRNNWP
jgi:hypothetical protein